MSASKHPELPNYPVNSSFYKLKEFLEENRLIALEAPTGSGKTTLLPLLMYYAGLSSKKILLTQPRRLAAKSVAQRMAQLTATKPGDLIGYRIRGESRVSADTRIEVVTEGYALAMLQADPFLSGYDWIIIDEFHERHIEGDLLLAFMRDLRLTLGPDNSPGLVLMTATWQGQPREKLEEFDFHSIEGRLFPVELKFFSDGFSRPIQKRLEWGVGQALSETAGKILCFLPGRRELENALNQFKTVHDELEISLLYGGMDFSAQQAVLAYNGPKRQLILSTAIAETSLTIEGVSAVVDSGLERLPLFQPNLGLTRLLTRQVSRAAAQQRAGRAGRLGPGSCYKLWSQSEDMELIKRWDPEILTGDLASARLQTALWGNCELPWITKPPEGLWQQAGQLLRTIDALDDDGKITERGRRLAALPLPPRLAHMVEAAPDKAEASLAAAILAEGHRFSFGSSSFSERLSMARSNGKLAPLRKEADEIMRRLQNSRTEAGFSDGSIMNRDSSTSTGSLLSLAFPDRIGKKKVTGSYELVTGSSLSCRECKSEWAVFPEVSVSRDRLIGHTAEEISLEDLRTWHKTLFEVRSNVIYQKKTGKFKKTQAEFIGKLQLNILPPGTITAEERLQAVKTAVKKTGIEALPLSKSALTLLERLIILNEAGIRNLPSGKAEDLVSDIDEWLGPWLGKDLSSSIISQALDSRLNWEQKNRIDKLLPKKIKLITGHEKSIDYSNTAQPLIRGKMQEFYGLNSPITIADGRITIAVEMLSPAMRPLQTTSDPAAFWRGSYSQIRAEMRGRYPKHYWPEKPETAEPSLATGKNRPD